MPLPDDQYTVPNFVDARNQMIEKPQQFYCADETREVDYFTASIIRVMIVKDFLGEDQNARKVICPLYFETSTEAGKSINIVMTCFKKLAEQ